MTTQIKKVGIIGGWFIAGALLAMGLSATAAWTPAPANPPADNVEAPINVGASTQGKAGGLTLGNETAVNGVNLFVYGSGAFENLGVLNNLSYATTSAGPGKALVSLDEYGTMAWADPGEDIADTGVLPPKIYIVGDDGIAAGYQCIHDIDLEDYCADVDGCQLRFISNLEVISGDNDVNRDETRVAVIDLQFEDESFSNNIKESLAGWANGTNANRRFELNDAVSEAPAFIWDNWFWLADHKPLSCTGVANAPYLGDDKYHFSLMTGPNVRTKMIVYDAVSPYEPVIDASQVPSDIYIYATDFSGDKEGCTFRSSLPSCEMSHRFRDGGNWTWAKCHENVEAYVKAQCPIYGASTFTWTDNRSATVF